MMKRLLLSAVAAAVALRVFAFEMFPTETTESGIILTPVSIPSLDSDGNYWENTGRVVGIPKQDGMTDWYWEQETGDPYFDPFYNGDAGLLAAMEALCVATSARSKADLLGRDITAILTELESISGKLGTCDSSCDCRTGGGDKEEWTIEGAKDYPTHKKYIDDGIKDGDDSVREAFAAADTSIREAFAAADTAIRTDFAAADTSIREDFTAADTAIRTDFAAADTSIREDFTAADTAIRGEFANADTEVERKLMGVIKAYHPDEGLPDEATNVLAKVAFSGKYTDLVDAPQVTNECVIVKEGDTYNIYPPGGGGEAATNAVGGLAELAVTGDWTSIVNIPTGNTVRVVSDITASTDKFTYTLKKAHVTASGLEFTGEPESHDVVFPEGGGGGTNECHCAGCGGGGGVNCQCQIKTAADVRAAEQDPEAMPRIDSLETRVSNLEEDMRKASARISVLEEAVGKKATAGVMPMPEDID